jgi:hypothetical protein
MLTPLLTALVSRDVRVSAPESAASNADHPDKLRRNPGTENTRCIESDQMARSPDTRTDAGRTDTAFRKHHDAESKTSVAGNSLRQVPHLADKYTGNSHGTKITQTPNK